MTNLIRVGEQGGTLDTELVELSDLFEKEEALKGEVQSALAYPTLVLLTGLISAVILIAFFIPRIKEMFEGVGQALPLPTRILLAMSDTVTGAPFLLLGILAAGFLGVFFGLRSPQVRLALDAFKLKVPWMGPLLQNMEIARLSRVLGTLTRGGVSIVDALAIVNPVMNNRLIAQEVKDITNRIRTGERLGVLMGEREVFPALCVQMVSVGEETGQLDEMLLRVADAYDRETSAATKVMTSMLAPVMILVVAAIVGFIVVSMLLPIFQMSSVIG
jgi:type II secretory pathway component PulF